MNWTDLAHSGIELWSQVLQGIVIVAMSLLGIVATKNHKSLRDIKGETAEIKGSVINGHKDQPLREDVDKVIAEVGKIAAAVDRMAQVVTDLRADAADERATRRTEIRELREDMDTRLTQLNRRLP